MGPLRATRCNVVIVGMGMAAVAYWKLFRPWSSRWGATDDDTRKTLPGDEIVHEPAVQTTQGITINAPPGAVWQWLVQMGPGRGGAYTYDWVENLFGLDMHSADRIVPEWQHTEAGDAFQLSKNGPPLRVEAIEPERALVLGLPDRTWSWVFVLEPLDEMRTRLVTRNRAPSDQFRARLQWELLLPGAFLMMRKMLLGIKERAERPASTTIATEG